MSGEPANFSFHDWEERTDPRIYSVPALNEMELPRPPDNYRPGHLTMGSNPDRGLAIQRGRGKKRFAANRAFFLENVLPLIADQLNPAAWKDLAGTLNDPTLYKRGGFTRYSLDTRASWIHQTETDKIAQVLAMGARPD